MATSSALLSLTLDPDTDDLRPVAALMADLTGRRPSPPTVWRWCVRGTRRAGCLPCLRIYGSWHTTRDALLAWLAADSQRGESAPGDEPGERDAATSQRLAQAGLI